MKNSFFFLLLISQIGIAQELVPFKQGNQYGYRLEKSIQITPQFEYAVDFTEGLALVKSNGKWGYIDNVGSWIIQPIFEKASPFSEGEAFVNLNGKIGLIQRDGRYSIEPKYEEVNRTEYGYLLKTGEFVGAYLQNNNKLIEAKYKSISKRGEFVSCQRTDNLWDIYKQGTVFLEKADQALKAGDQDNDLITFYVNGKKGIYQFDKGWLFEPKYEEIYKFDTYEYTTANNTYSYGYSLILKTEWNIDPDLGETTYSQLATGDGNLLSQEVFDYVKSNFAFVEGNNACFICMEMTSKDKHFIVTSNMEIKPFDFTNLRQQAGFVLGDKGDFTYIIEKDLSPRDSFYAVEPITFLELFETDYGETEVLPVIHSDYELVWVSKREDTKIVHALYDLNKNKVISDWYSATSDLTVETITVGNETVHLVNNAESKYAFYHRFLDRITDFKYLSVTHPMANFLVGMDYKTNQTSIFSVNLNSIEQLAVEHKIYSSKLLRRDEYTDNNDVIYHQFFQREFMVLENKGGKLGLITETQKLFSPQFDSLHPCDANVDFITTRLNGKFGLIHLNSGSQITPSSDIPYEPFFDDSLLTYFVQVGIGETAYYLDINGRKLQSLRPKIEVISVKKRLGIQTNNDFKPAEKFVTIPPSYRSLIPIAGNNFIAQSTTKKYGIISYLGDTIVPFNYSKIEFYANDLANPSWQYYRIFNGKNVGIASNFSGIIFDAMYTSVEMVDGTGWLSTAFILEKKGRFGLGDYSGQLIMDCIYDSIARNHLGRSTEFGMFEGKIGAKSYVQTVSYYETGFFKMNTSMRPLDLIIGEYGYIKQGEHFEKYGLVLNDFVARLSSLNESYSNGEFRLAYKDGKWGAIDYMGNTLIDFIYDNATFMQDRSEVMIGYENGVKYYIYVFTKERYTENEW